ncbi:MAG: hypothetical protein WC095_02680 [Candidatus Paceibacterota bacterium]
MSIKDFIEKIKPLYTILLFLVIASIFFTLGRISAIEDKKTPLKIQNINNDSNNKVLSAAVIESQDISVLSTTSISNKDRESGQVIGSKSGKKYYFPWCGTLKAVKEVNRVNFASIEEAKKAGYVAAKNCKGLW